MASPINDKRLQDANAYSGGYSATATDYAGNAVGGMVKALPNAAANNTTDYIDTQLAGNAAMEGCWLIIDIPALSWHTDNTKYVTFDILSSTSTTVTAAVSPVHQYKLVGVTSTGSAATQKYFRIPPSASRYIAVKQTIDSGPTSGNDNITYRLAF